MDKLKPCPFCGGKPKLIIQNRTVIKGTVVRNCYVHCLNCDARGSRFLEGETAETHKIARESARLAWNARVGREQGDIDNVCKKVLPTATK